MIKIIVVTHGPLAQALKESSAMFFGNTSDSISAIGLFPKDNPEDLKEEICKEINRIDEGDGVMVFVDIFAGSPFNMTALSIDELKESHKIECYTGINMPLLMEALAGCEYMNLEEMTKHIKDVSKDSIVNLREKLDI